MPVKELLLWGERQLREAGVADAARDCKSLYCFLMGIPDSMIVLEYQNIIQDSISEKYFQLIERRAAGEPLQYIVGSQDFMGFKILVDERVLIPRLDTEVLVEDAVSLINDGSLRGEIKGKPGENWDVLDLCSGSGAIGIAVQKLCPKAKVTCSDISEGALKLAKENADLNEVGRKIKFLKGDMFEPLNGRFHKATFDMIIVNPPYIASGEIEKLQTEVKDHEPRKALDGGLDFYRIIASQASKHLKKGGCLFLEIGYDQREAVTGLLQATGEFDEVRCFKDLAGLDRIVYAHCPWKK